MTVNDWLSAGAATIAILIGVATLTRMFVGRLTIFFKHLIDDNQRELLKRMDIQDVEIREIKHEVTFNGGSSLKDVVREVRQEQRDVKAILERSTPPAT